MRDYAEIWRAADKVVFSSTMESVSTARTTLERRLRSRCRRRAEGIGRRATSAWAGPVWRPKRCEPVSSTSVTSTVNPVDRGRRHGRPPGHLRLDLELLDERRFGNGVVLVQYRIRS